MIRLGFALCGSFCTFDTVFPVFETLCAEYAVTPVFSEAAQGFDTRFGEASDWLRKFEAACGRTAITTIPAAEPIGPKKLFDILVVAPATGNTLAKLSNGIADSSVTFACKAQLRNAAPIVLAVSTNDGLGAAAVNIGTLLPRRNYYFVPFRQDDCRGKPTSLVADFSLIPATVAAALEGRQLQPLLLGCGK